MREELVVVFHEGHVTSLVRSDAHSSSTYGGPLEHKTSGQSLQRPVHHVAHLSVAQLPFLGAPRYVVDLPLVYGLYYEASNIKYTFGHGSISIESLLPNRPLDGWPYEGYPRMLPYVPLEVGEVSEASWSIFLSRAPNLPEEQPREVVILVPPPATLGFSMWGKAAMLRVSHSSLSAHWSRSVLLHITCAANPAPNRAPSGRWTLRNTAAQRRLAPRWA